MKATIQKAKVFDIAHAKYQPYSAIQFIPSEWIKKVLMSTSFLTTSIKRNAMSVMVDGGGQL
jgi:hypothetical protein